MATLNEYASRIVGILGREGNHAMRERIKAAFKSILATRIRQSIAKNGIDESMVITLEVGISEDEYLFIKNFKIFRANFTIPAILRFNNDAPFTFVGFDTGESFSNKSLIEIKLSTKYDKKGFSKYYTFENNILRLFVRTKHKNLELLDSNYNKIIVKTIFENPEEVITFYTSDDAQDVQLPFPSDMLESVILELLKTEFNYIPPETEIKV